MPRRTSRTASASAPIPVVSPSWPMPPQETVEHLEVGLHYSCGVMLLFSGSWCMRDFVCALQEWYVCFPYLSGSPMIKSHCPSRSDDQGIPSPFVRTAGWVVWCEVQSFHNRGRSSLVFLFSSYLLRGYGIWIHCDCTPPIMLLRLPLFLWTWGIIFGVFQRPPVDSCSIASCSYGAGGDEQTSSYTTVLKQKPLKYSLE